jgi:hypothetical protein
LKTALEIVRPEDCSLAVAIPLDEWRFRAAAVAGSPPGNFVQTWMRLNPGRSIGEAWLEYAPYAVHAADVVLEARQMGVAVRTAASFNDWAELFGIRSVVTLFAHLSDDDADHACVEFGDGNYKIVDLIDAIPESYNGVVDFTVCRSLAFLPVIKTARPQCTVVAVKDPARVDYRFAIYRQVIRLLSAGTFTYPEAVTALHRAVLESNPDEKESHGSQPNG